MRSLTENGLTANHQNPLDLKHRLQKFQSRERESASRLAATVEEGVSSRSWGSVMQLCERLSRETLCKDLLQQGRRSVCLCLFFLHFPFFATCHATLIRSGCTTGLLVTPVMFCPDLLWTPQTPITCSSVLSFLLKTCCSTCTVRTRVPKV